MISSWPLTERKMTGTSETSRISFISSMPSVPGSIRSNSTRPGSFARTRLVASCGSPVTIGA